MAEKNGTPLPNGWRAVKLRQPIKVGDDGPTITELTVRPVTGKDLRRLPEGALDRRVALAGRLSGQPDHVIDKLVGEDLFEVLEVVDGFLEPSPKAGSDTSPT